MKDWYGACGYEVITTMGICKMLLHTLTAISPASLLNHPCCLNECRSIESCSAVRPNHCWYSSDLLEISWHTRSLKCKVSLSSLIPRPRLFIKSVYLDMSSLWSFSEFPRYLWWRHLIILRKQQFPSPATSILAESKGSQITFKRFTVTASGSFPFYGMLFCLTPALLFVEKNLRSRELRLIVDYYFIILIC